MNTMTAAPAKTHYIVIVRRIATGEILRQRVTLIDGYTTEADIPAIVTVATNWEPIEIIKWAAE